MATPLASNNIPRSAFAVLWILAATILLVAASQVYLGGKLLLQHDVPSRLMALSHWRDLEQFTGWILILILALADQFEKGGGGYGKKIVPWILAAGLAVTFSSILPAFESDRPTTELIAAGLLALAAAIIALRQLAGIARTGQGGAAGGGGITIEQLWRLLAVQWMLVWVAAECFLRFKFRREGVTDEAARSLLFALPAIGAGPNILMAVGIRWWQTLRLRAGSAWQAGPPRPRAWLVALLAVNLGSLGVVAGGIAPRCLAVAGTVPLIFGVLMYILGFGRGAWASEGRLVLASLCLFIAGIILFAVERITGGNGALWEYTAAWRLLVGLAASLAWLAGFGNIAMQTCVYPTVRAPVAARLSQTLLVLALLATAGFLALAGAAGREWLEGIAFATLMEFMGVLLALAVLVRCLRAIR